MTLKKHNTLYFIVDIISAALFFSCEGNFKDVQQITFSEFTTIGEAEDFNLKFTEPFDITKLL